MNAFLKTIRFSLFFCVGLWIAACSDNDELLMSHIKGRPLVNPQASRLLTSGGIRLAKLGAQGELVLCNSKQMAYSPDFFKNISYVPSHIEWGRNGQEGLRLDPDGRYVRYYWDEFDLHIQQYERGELQMEFGNRKDGAGFEGSFRDVFFTDGSRGFVLTKTRQHTKLYEIAEGRVRWLKDFDASPYCRVRFVNAREGYVFLGKTYCRTADGGKTWTAPELFLENASPWGSLKIDRWEIVGPAHWWVQVHYYDKNDAYVVQEFQTRDAGKTWEEIELGEGWKVHQMVSPDFWVIQQDDHSHRRFCTYKPKTQERPAQFRWDDTWGKVYFLNETWGILYDSTELMVTNDGGKNWHTLLYPYPFLYD